MQKEIDFLGNAVNNPVRPFRSYPWWCKGFCLRFHVINNLLDKV